MPTYTRIPCPKCGHELKIREEYLGQRVACKHCSHAFVARAEEPAPASRPAPPLDPAPMALDLDTDLSELWDPEPSVAPAPSSKKIEESDPDLGDIPFDLRIDEEDLFGTGVPDADRASRSSPNCSEPSTRREPSATDGARTPRRFAHGPPSRTPETTSSVRLARNAIA